MIGMHIVGFQSARSKLQGRYRDVAHPHGFLHYIPSAIVFADQVAGLVVHKIRGAR